MIQPHNPISSPIINHFHKRQQLQAWLRVAEQEKHQREVEARFCTMGSGDFPLASSGLLRKWDFPVAIGRHGINDDQCFSFFDFMEFFLVG